MRIRMLAAIATIALLGSFIATPSQLARAQQPVSVLLATGQIPHPELKTGGVIRRLPTLSGSRVATILDSLGSQRANTNAYQNTQPNPLSFGCSLRNPGNGVRVNQDCTFRRQAEEGIAANPVKPTNLIAGQNDSRIGWNHCGFDFSVNSGASWGDGIPPFYQHLNSPENDGTNTITAMAGTEHTYDAGSDPAVTFDADGNAFFTCVLFDIFDNAAGILVGRSFTGGSFYNNVPYTGPDYVVVEDNDPAIVHDKEFITADSYSNSPYRDNVYVVWTVFNLDPRCSTTPGQYGYCSSPIYFSRSTDHALSWSTPIEISGNNPALCSNGNAFDPLANANDCNFDQGADPAVLPNGNIVVTFNNGNTATGNPNGQQLAVISTDGGQTFGTPVFVGDDIVSTAPFCDFGDECVPGQYARTNDFPRIAVDHSNGHLYAAWQDYRTGKFSIVVTQSTDGGNTWVAAGGQPDDGSTSNAVAVSRNDGTDDSQAAIAVSPINHAVAFSYYRTTRVPNEDAVCAFSGGGCGTGSPGVGAENSDYALSYAHTLTGPFTAQEVAKPFPAPDPNGIQAGFIGDYSGLTFVSTIAHPIWASTVSQAPPGQGTTNDEDVYTGTVVTH